MVLDELLYMFVFTFDTQQFNLELELFIPLGVELFSPRFEFIDPVLKFIPPGVLFLSPGIYGFVPPG